MKSLFFTFFCIYLIFSYTCAQSLPANTDLRICYPNLNGNEDYVSKLRSGLLGYRSKYNRSPNSSALFSLIPLKTPNVGEYLRILIIYVKFPDDNVGGDPLNGFGIWWDPNWIRPLNPYTSDNKLIDSAEQNPSIPYMNR